jgi:hypothetical protein
VRCAVCRDEKGWQEESVSELRTGLRSKDRYRYYIVFITTKSKDYGGANAPHFNWHCLLL